MEKCNNGVGHTYNIKKFGVSSYPLNCLDVHIHSKWLPKNTGTHRHPCVFFIVAHTCDGETRWANKECAFLVREGSSLKASM